MPPQTAAVEAQDQTPIRLTVVGTNDFHGWVQPARRCTVAGRSVRGGRRGGLRRLPRDVLRADNPGGVLLLDARRPLPGHAGLQPHRGRGGDRRLQPARLRRPRPSATTSSTTARSARSRCAAEPGDGPVRRAQGPASRRRSFPLLAANIYDADDRPAPRVAAATTAPLMLEREGRQGRHRRASPRRTTPYDHQPGQRGVAALRQPGPGGAGGGASGCARRAPRW